MRHKRIDIRELKSLRERVEVLRKAGMSASHLTSTLSILSALTTTSALGPVSSSRTPRDTTETRWRWPPHRLSVIGSRWSGATRRSTSLVDVDPATVVPPCPYKQPDDITMTACRRRMQASVAVRVTRARDWGSGASSSCTSPHHRVDTLHELGDSFPLSLVNVAFGPANSRTCRACNSKQRHRQLGLGIRNAAALRSGRSWYCRAYPGAAASR
jgi:hypothetical protein